ncbi:MAG: NADPH-dependent FMN reductase [Nannocystales bacterium]
MNIATIAGSLRKASINRGLLSACRDVAPEGVTFQALSIGELPHYDGDLAAAGDPGPVAVFKAAIAAADGLLIATPEYNYSVPGVLKNALDWASRPAYRSVFAGKKTAMLGASYSVVGTARAQAHLKGIMLGMAAPVFAYPEVLVGAAKEKFDAAGNLTDPSTCEHLAGFVAAFATWVGTP